MSTAPALALHFQGNPITILKAEDGPLWLAKQVSIALGYSKPGQVSQNIREKWSDELDEGADYRVESRKVLESFSSPDLGVLVFNPRGETVLTEQGLFGVINLVRTDTGRRFRRWLRSEVLPAIARTGSYTVPNAEPVQGALFEGTADADPKERRRQVEAAAKAKNASVRQQLADLKEREARARYELDREIAHLQAAREANEAKFSAALEAVGGQGADVQARLAALGWAFGEDVGALKLAVAAAEMRSTPLPSCDIVAPAIAVKDWTGWLSASSIAKKIDNPAVDARKVGLAAAQLGLRGSTESHCERMKNKSGQEYDLWTYSPKAIKRIIAHITGSQQ